jgi:tetratricopeptide (TPR) repeat protein
MERFLEIARARGEPAMSSAAFQSLGSLKGELGESRAALLLFEDALAIEERLGRRPFVALCLMRIGQCHSQLGDVRQALSYLDRALDLLRELGDARNEAACLTAIGGVHKTLGDPKRSRLYHEQALRIHERTGTQSYVGTALNNLGNACLESADPVAARGYYTRAIALHRELGQASGEALALGNLALTFGQEKRWGEARETALEALALTEKVGNPLEVAKTLKILASLQQSAGDFDEALGSWRRCLDLATESASLETEIQAWRGLAGTQLDLGRPREAIASAREAIDRRRYFVQGLGAREGAGAGERFRDAYPGILASMALEDAGELLFFVESGRAHALLEALGGREALRDVVLPEALRKLESEARAAEAAAHARYLRAREGGKRADVQERREELRASRARVEEVVARVRREAKGATSVVYPEPLSLAAVQGGLGGGEALVLYHLEDEEGIALVITAKSADARRLGPAARIEELCGTRAFEEPGRETADALPGLRRRIIEPLGLADGIRRVIVSPDGALAHVPFSALFPDRDVLHVPSATTWGFLRGEAGPPGEAVLALGNPDYGTRADLRALPASADEAKAVGDVVLLGDAATEGGLRESLAKRERWRALHLACHGLVDPEHPLLSSLALTAGAEDDGLLSSLEVFGLRIPADLVVLSACETARGKVYRSEGVMGFTRAFLYAGAPRVIVSLWKVDDRATRALMTRFYELWKGGEVPAAEALRRAQEHVRAQKGWEHPYFWAAWQLWGLGD